MKKLSKLSDNELSELLTMTYRMIELAKEFSHVKHHIPKPMYNSITKLYSDLCNEKDRREDEFQ